MTSPTWGDEVVVRKDAPSRYRPGSRAWVVGVGAVGVQLLTIEFDDGSSVDIPPTLVRLVNRK
jgi:hypothetical protein